LIVLSSLFLSHQILKIYNQSVELNQQWVLQGDKNAELGMLAGAVNAPGNDLFDSHDVGGESQRMRAALKTFNEHMAVVEADLSVQIRGKSRNERTIQADVERFPEDLATIKSAMAEMTNEAELIFSYFGQNQPEKAGRRMATMDQKYAKLLGSLARLREHISTIQEKLFKQELESADSMRKLEHGIAGFVLLMVGAAMAYGHKMKNQMEGAAREKQSHLEELQREVTERREAEEARDESERKLSIHIQKTPLAAIEVNLKGEIVEWNPAAETIFGYSREEVIGRSVFGVLVPESANEYADQIWEDLVSKKGGWRTTHENLTKDGRIIICDWYNTSLDSGGKVIGVASLGQDITERTRMEAELSQAHDGALESARLKSEFLANMSHEIRTPMNGVVGMTGLLLDTELDSDQREFAETIRSSGEALLTIINDILDFSKIEAGKLEFEIVDFDLRNAVEETMELLAEMARAKRLEFASLIYHDVPTELCGDQGRLRQVLTNLVGNALKFTEQGEVIVRGEKESESETHVTIRFTVSDTGIGINEAAQTRLFQAFTQADGSTTRKYGGTGLGLSISKKLVEMMGGTMGVSSSLGKGSVFWFTAQLGKQSASPAPELRQGESIENLRVLIVDDNATNRTILSHQLGSWGMIHDEAASGMEALGLIKAAAANGGGYDLAILDLLMPEMDGFELARAIKSDSDIAGVHLVLLTSAGVRGDGATARAAGIAAYLAKPIRQSQLFDCLTTVVGNSLSSDGVAATNLVTKHSLQEAKRMSNKLILLAEDNIVNQKVAVRQLQKLGYRADAVANGREAIEALSRIPYDLVLMDCQMPVMDGYEAATEIRRIEGATRHTPIVAMTAHALSGDREKSIAAGMDDHITKPVKQEELARVLEKFFEDTRANVPTIEAPEHELAPPVDLDRLHQAMGDDPEEILEILNLYRMEMGLNLIRLEEAITSGDASEVDMIAHNCAGTSANCGMVAVVEQLRELERMGRENQLEGAASLNEQVVIDFERIKRFLEERFEPLALH
jgi:PAS domain S-box-containing protein